MGAPKIEIWHGDEQRFGMSGVSQRWINILGRVRSSNGLYNLRWALDDGPWAPLAFGPTAYRLLGRGDFNVEIDRDVLEPGEHVVRIAAFDRQCNQTEKTVRVFIEPESDISLPFQIDWERVERINDVAQVVDGEWELSERGVRPLELGYDRVVALGSRAWRDFVVTVEMTFHRFSDDPLTYIPPSMHAWAGLGLRWQGHHDWNDIYPRRGYHPFGALVMNRQDSPDEQPRWRICGNRVRPACEDTSGNTTELGCPYMLKAYAQSQPEGLSRYGMKFWPKEHREPGEWLMEGDGTAGELPGGSILLVSHHVDVTFGRVRVEPL